MLGVNHPYSKEPNSPAEAAARTILEMRGNTPRLYRNTLVFLAVDQTRLQDLEGLQPLPSGLLSAPRIVVEK